MSHDADGSPDALIERALRGEATPEESARLDAWRRAAPSNEKEFQRAARLVEAAGALRFTGAVVPARPSAASIVGRVAPGSERAATRHWPRWLPWSVAAAAVLVAGIGLSVRGSAGGWEPAEVVTGEAELATVKLGDGTVVRLAPSSRLRVLGGRTREVALEGRAFFAVTHSPNQPFRVHTSAATANVLGTRFELATDDGGVRLEVLEGRVALDAARNSVEVGAGQASGVRNGEATAPERIANPAAAVPPAWLGKFLAFQETPLRDAAREIERLYDVRVVVTDSMLVAATITATFTDRQAREVVSVVCAVLNAACTWIDDTVSMKR